MPRLLLSLLLIGLGYLALLPPFEGFDETAHYASLRQITDTHTLPIYGQSFMPQDVVDYTGPSPYDTLAPPYDHGLAYPSFFRDPALVARFGPAYRSPQPAPPFAASLRPNWQAQHPPLYYLALAPVLKAVQGMGFVAQIFILRLASYLLALGGVWLGWKAVPAGDKAARLGFLLYPIMLPMFFPEFARIGNDSLCLLLTGAAAYSLARLTKERTTGWALLLGLSLGLGLLTKALFLPVTVGVGIFLILSWLKTVPRETSHIRLLPLLFAVLIGGGWYVYKYLAFGEATGSDDAIRLAQRGGLWLNLTRDFSLYAILRGVAVTLASWVWGGTWSLTRLPAWLEVPPVALAFWTLGSWLAALRGRKLTDPVFLPATILAVFGAGLFYHILISVALNGNGNTPGWYLHILLPWVAPALGIGAARIARNPTQRRIFTALLAYSLAYHAMALWAEFAMVTGCAVKGDDKLFHFTAPGFCLSAWPLLIDRLGVTGWPWLAGIGLGGGFLCLALLAIRAARRLNRGIKPTQTA